MKKIVCLGDSLTEGFGLEAYENYPYLLQQSLGDEYEVINVGATAHCVIDAVAPDGRVMLLPYVRTEKYARGIAEKGDIYIIMLGTNDAQDGLADDGSYVDIYANMIALEGEFNRHYERIIKDVKQANPNAKIIIGRPTPILKCIWPKHQQKYLDVILKHIDEVCAEHPEFTVVDMQNIFRVKGQEWLEQIYQADGLHPGPEGAKLIAEEFEKAVRGLDVSNY